MCDWFSWGVLNPTTQKKLGLKSRIVYLTDDMAQTLIDSDGCVKGGRNWSWDDVAGHTAIAAYYGIDIDSFLHKENPYQVPRCAVPDINNGKMDRIQKATGNVGWRYTSHGIRKSASYVAAVKKAIEELAPQFDVNAKEAMAYYKKHGLGKPIGAAFVWNSSPQGHSFWQAVCSAVRE